jgi:hypothetical protein
MKYSVCLMTISAAVIAAMMPASVRAEGLVSQVISPGYSTTTIYVPFGTTTTTTTTDQVITNGDPDRNSTSTSTTTYDNGGGFYYTNRPRRQYHQHRQPTVVFQQNNIYPYSSPSACTTTMIGSPIPSPIPLNRYTGQPCR